MVENMKVQLLVEAFDFMMILKLIKAIIFIGLSKKLNLLNKNSITFKNLIFSINFIEQHLWHFSGNFIIPSTNKFLSFSAMSHTKNFLQ